MPKILAKTQRYPSRPYIHTNTFIRSILHHPNSQVPRKRHHPSRPFIHTGASITFISFTLELVDNANTHKWYCELVAVPCLWFCSSCCCCCCQPQNPLDVPVDDRRLVLVVHCWHWTSSHSKRGSTSCWTRPERGPGPFQNYWYPNENEDGKHENQKRRHDRGGKGKGMSWVNK